MLGNGGGLPGVGRAALAVFAVVLILVPGPGLFTLPSPTGPTSHSESVAWAPSASPDASSLPPNETPPANMLGISQLKLSSFVPIIDAPSDAIVPNSVSSPQRTPAHFDVLVTFRPSNDSELASFLNALSDPAAPTYHHYLTASQFDERYSPPASVYNAALRYFSSFGVSNLTSLPDRLSLSFGASARQAESIFRTSIGGYSVARNFYEAPSAPVELPMPLAVEITQVAGLSTYSPPGLSTSSGEAVSPPALPMPGKSPAPATIAGLPVPPTIGGTQFDYASDFQVAYDESGLFSQFGYPTNITAATILWSGTYTGPTGETGCGYLTEGQNVGPWVPSDVYGYYNETLPSGEPHAQVVGVPFGGAASPGPEASCATDFQHVEENTLDLEMLGSTAPGASIYNVYGPDVNIHTDVDEGLADILSPPSTFPAAVRAGLLNVSVISVSTQLIPETDAALSTSLEQAQARGISFLSSSGDSDDNPSSSDYFGAPLYLPSEMAYDAYGATAVGGTTTTLDPATLEIENQVVWNISAQDTLDGGPAGSTGGISTNYPEPSWQLSSEANTVLHGSGRGVPDLSAIANNTLVTQTEDGYQYLAVNASEGGRFWSDWGTSVASPLLAGVVAEMNHASLTEGRGTLGFLNPLMYEIASAAYLDGTTPAPFSDVTLGSNYHYPALPGYDLATGWGTLNALNYTSLLFDAPLVVFAETGLPAGTTWTVTLNGATESATAPSSIVFAERNGTYSYSIGSVADYTANVSSGSLTMKGWPLSQVISFTPQFTLTSVAVDPISDTLPAGGSAIFTALPSCEGGACPSPETRIFWSLSNSLGSLNSSSGSTITVTALSVGGSVTLTVRATLLGGSAWANATISITAPSGVFGLPELEAYALFGGLFLVIAAAVVVVAVRRRRKPKPVPSQPAAGSVGRSWLPPPPPPD